ncbi:anhydro-N-acetylmuramic acid kinase [Gandjariella thermophila]|uniref:Anhydro-N-acetylmuramic acid kinase n=1 Tax=Gandjariella thermophila TaxID=1931992 RepID=A0A4D4J1Y7_9PSEU|nr:anhydro-N-acetylmuramic acid kinase [Gandjariella thermophila]GDY30635.1 anhydro-N-acetylmuramic acid kinase [Gandjariella thermophila]
MDGIDVAVADLRMAGAELEVALRGHLTAGYPDRVREALIGSLPPAACTTVELCELHTAAGQAFAAAAVRGIDELAGGHADLVASLGQTVAHRVSDGRCLGTLQLGQPAWIAEATGLPVVADLRARDVAAGGHGAPLAATLDRLWLAGMASADRPAVAVNLGGIANITVVSGADEPLAYDTGPGNALLDAAVRLISHGRLDLDTDGRLAARGTVRRDLLDTLLADPYYAMRPPKSTGKEHFRLGYLRRAVRGLPPIEDTDLLATLVELTAATVADACLAHRAGRVIASGGGVRNPTLMAALARRLDPVPLSTSDDLGLPSDAKEAVLAALLGFLTWHGVPANPPSATGASGPRLLGSITPGRAPLRLPAPWRRPISRLRLLDAALPVGGGRQ